MSERQIVLNRIKTPDGTILTSYHVHDYQSYVDRNGNHYSVDGGTEYLARSYDTPDYEELSVFDDDPFEKVRESFHWGVLLKRGSKTTHQFKRLCDLETDHIENIIENKMGSEWVRGLMNKELNFRK